MVLTVHDCACAGNICAARAAAASVKTIKREVIGTLPWIGMVAALHGTAKHFVETANLITNGCDRAHSVVWFTAL